MLCYYQNLMLHHVIWFTKVFIWWINSKWWSIHLFKRKLWEHDCYIVLIFCEFFSRNCPDPNPRGPPHCDPRGGVLLPVWIPHYIVVHSGVYTDCENMLKYAKMWIISLFVSCIKSYWMVCLNYCKLCGYLNYCFALVRKSVHPCVLTFRSCGTW